MKIRVLINQPKYFRTKGEQCDNCSRKAGQATERRTDVLLINIAHRGTYTVCPLCFLEWSDLDDMPNMKVRPG
jgi:hypothetical protein